MKRQYNFPGNLRTLLTGKGIKQASLAKVIKKTQGSISKYCAGSKTPTINVILKIADYFDVSLDDLVCGKVKK